MLRITLTVPADADALGARWRAFEAEAAGSFFQSWTWLGCRFAARFTDPVLLAAEADGRTLALALFNRRRGAAGDTLWLGESGDAAEDAVFTEHNGPLLAAGAPAGLALACLKAARGGTLAGLRRFGRRVVLSGIGADLAAAAATLPGTLARGPARPAPCVDFASLRAAGQDHAASLSANSRAQLRRSLRRYGAAGTLAIRAAADLDEARAFLDALAGLHQASWQRRGQPGAFANPAFRAFHQALIARAWPRGEAELLHVTAGGETIGYLYNFLWRGWALAYQSGFVYPPDDAQRKPGLTCHHLAIARHLAGGMAGYDFLAGAARYKSSLGNVEHELAWLELGPAWRPAALRQHLTRTA